ncbi:serine/threonine protein kinase [Patescibacteria group bacterium]|nr:serine/threonine protein kinase [Patescibacteria group bacterium]MBU1922483.1 serine/threonine protein kinase [Patescibacteria group bacterium]
MNRQRVESLDEIVDRLCDKVIDDRYKVNEFIAAGGMSYVFKGTHLALDCDIAIKFLQKEQAVHEAILTRFERESLALARIRHPNVVTVHDRGVWHNEYALEGNGSAEHEDWHFFVMEYLGGKTLEDLLDDPDMEHFSVEGACSIVSQVLRGVQAIHSCRDEKLGDVVHRDLKPGNIKVVGQGFPLTVKILDMGVAHFGSGELSLSSVTFADRIFGTPHFMAPEQARGDNDAVNRTTDIYAAGGILFNILTKRRPYESAASTMAVVLSAHIKEPPPRPSDFRKGIPGKIDAIVLKAMAKEQKDRFQSADEMREALYEAVYGSSSSALNPTDPSLRSRINGRTVSGSPVEADTHKTKEFAVADTLLSDPPLPPSKKKRFPGWRVGILFLVLVGLAGIFVYMRNIESRLPKPDVKVSQSDGFSEAEEAKVDQKVAVSEDAVISAPEEPAAPSKPKSKRVTEDGLSPTAKMVWDNVKKGSCSKKNMAAVEKTVANYPGFAQGHKWLSKCYRNKGKSAKALEHEQLYEQLR